MLQWIKLYWIYEETSFSTKANGFLYFLTKIPWIGKHLPHDLYGQYGLKKMVFTLLFSFRLILPFFTKIIWLLLYYAVALFALHGWDPLFDSFGRFEEQVMIAGFYTWLVMVALASNFFYLFSFTLEQKAIEFTDYFMVSKRQYLRMTLFFKTIQAIIYYLPALLLYSFFAGNGWLSFVGIFGAVFACVAAASLIRRGFQKQWGRGWRIGCRLAVSLLIVVSLYSLLLQQIIPTATFGGGLFAFFLIGGSGCLYYLKHFTQEDAFFLYSVEKSYQQISVLESIASDSNQYLSEGIEMQKKLSLDQEKPLTHLQGSEYLNGLLFQRYRKLLHKKLLKRVGIVAILFLGLILLTLLKILPYPNEEDLTKVLPALFLVMYFGSLGKAIVQMVFVNCDISLLYYPFYREKETILSGFNYRFIKSMFYNGVFAGSIFGGFFILNFLNGGRTSWYFIGVLFLLLTSLTALFSFHELFIYYLLQPFTGDMKVVNPVYKFVSGALYWLCYINLRLQITGFAYSIVVSIVLLCYVLVGYLLILRLAPQTFRMKE
jgi:hypothetical protein